MIGKAIYNLLTTNVAVSALVSTRVYPNVNFSSKTTYPFIVFQTTNDDPHDTKSGSVLIKCFSDNALSVQELAEKVRISLDRKSGIFGTIVVQSIQYESMSNSYEFQEIEANDGLFMTAQNFNCRYNPINN